MTAEPVPMRDTLMRDVTTVGAATLLSRLLGFVRDAGIAAILGAGVLSDAYFAALLIPNLFRRLLAEGALNSAFIPLWLRIESGDGAEAARRFAEQVLGILLAVLGLIAIACVAFAPLIVGLIAPGFSVGDLRFDLAIAFVRLSAPYIALAGIVAVAASVLNARGRVGAAAFGPVVFNGALILAVLLVIGSATKGSALAGYVLSAAVVVAGLAQLALAGGAIMQMPHAPIRPRLTLSAQPRRFFARALPGAIAAGVPQLKLIAGAMIASSSPASVSWLYYATRLYELPLGVVSVAIASVMGPAIAMSTRSAARAVTADTQGRTLEMALGLALPAAAALAILAAPIAGGLFEHGEFSPDDTATVAAVLTAICAGLPGHVLEKVFGAISFAHEDTHTPMLAALTGLAAAVTGALVLFPDYGVVGIAAAIAMSGWVGAAILGVALARRGWLHVDPAARRRLVLIVLATAIMALALLGAQSLLAAAVNLRVSSVLRLLHLVAMVAFGLAVYGAALQALGVARLRGLVAVFRKRS